MSGELIIAARVFDSSEYDAERLRLHTSAIAAQPDAADIYPGSTIARCAGCGVRVAVGPRQQEAIRKAGEERQTVVVLCLLDAAVAFRPQPATVVSLQNPWRRRD